MELPSYLKVLWAYKWLLVIGIVVAVAAGIFSGYSVGPGGLTSRAVESYTATTTIVVTSAKDTLYQAEIPAQRITEGYTAPESIDLTNTAVIYAYIISGSELRNTVAEQVGALDPEIEWVTAVRRTTQPGGNERFPGNLRLPVIDINATAPTPDRAGELAAATTEEFLAYVKTEQDERDLRTNQRVRLEVINVGDPVALEGGNPNTPVVFTAFGVLVAVLSLIFALHGIRSSRARKRAGRVGAARAKGIKRAAADARASGREPEQESVSTPADDSTNGTAPAATAAAAASQPEHAPTTNPADSTNGTAPAATTATAAASQPEHAPTTNPADSTNGTAPAATTATAAASQPEHAPTTNPADSTNGTAPAATTATAAASQPEHAPTNQLFSPPVLTGDGDEGSDGHTRFVAAQVSSNGKVALDHWNLYEPDTATEGTSNPVDRPSNGALSSPDLPVEAALPNSRSPQVGMRT